MLEVVSTAIHGGAAAVNANRTGLSGGAIGYTFVSFVNNAPRALLQGWSIFDLCMSIDLLLIFTG